MGRKLVEYATTAANDDRLSFKIVDIKIAGARKKVPTATEEELVAIRADMLDLLREVNETTAKIKTNIDFQRREFAAGGEAADRDWMLRAERAAATFGRTKQLISQVLGEIKQRHKQIVAERKASMSVEGIDIEQVRYFWRRLGIVLGELKEEE